MNSIAAPPASLSASAHLRAAILQTWHELPRSMAACALLVASAGPAGFALATGAPPWITMAALLPVALVLTGAARVGAFASRGARLRTVDVLSVDPVLAALAAAAVAAAAALILAGGPWAVVGAVVSALTAVIAPLALTYGAVRGRRGLAALRGGAILAAYRPGTAITVLSVDVLGAFVVVASLGTLALVIPILLACFSARLVSDDLARIDAAQEAQR